MPMVVVMVVAAMVMVIAVMMAVTTVSTPVPAAAIRLLGVPIAPPAPVDLYDSGLGAGERFDRARQRDRRGLRRRGHHRAGQQQRGGREKKLQARHCLLHCCCAGCVPRCASSSPLG